MAHLSAHSSWILALSLSLSCGVLSLSAPATALAAEAKAAADAENSNIVAKLQHFFPLYRAVPSDLILRADITRTSAGTEAKVLGAASGMLDCLFSDADSGDCMQASAQLGTNTELTAQEIVDILEQGFSTPEARFTALRDYVTRLEDKVVNLNKAATRVHETQSRQFSALKSKIRNGETTSFELYKSAADINVNLELMKANLERYQFTVEQVEQALSMLLGAGKTTIAEAQAKMQLKEVQDCDEQITTYALQVARLNDITATWQQEHDLLSLTAITQEAREDEGESPNFIYLLINSAESAAQKLTAMIKGDTATASESEPALEMAQRSSVQNELLQEQMQSIYQRDQQQMQLEGELSQLKQDKVKLQKQLAYYETAMAMMQNQLTENQTLLQDMQEQKQELLQANQQGSLDSNDKHKLKEYEQYIAKLEGEIESIRSSYLDYAEYRNVLNIEAEQ